jgi:hypothetical protein
VLRFGAQLPLSSDFAQLHRRGTRHGAALGLAERTDAVSIVVSEERGQISIARDGVLRALEKPEDLATVLPALLRPRGPQIGRRQLLLRALRERWVEKLVSVGLACGLWIAFVPGAQVAELTYSLPVTVDNVPPGFTVDKVDPATVEVTLSGARRVFFLLDQKRLAVRLDAFLVESGRRTFELAPDDVVRPDGVTVAGIEPRRVRLSVRKGNGDNGSGGAPPEG